MVAVLGVLPVVAGAGGVGGASGGFGALSRGDPLRESSNTPNRPELAPKPGKGARKLPIYIGSSPECPWSAPGVPRSAPNRLKPLSTKNQSFVSDNLPYKAFIGRITPNFDISL